MSPIEIAFVAGSAISGMLLFLGLWRGVEWLRRPRKSKAPAAAVAAPVALPGPDALFPPEDQAALAGESVAANAESLPIEDRPASEAVADETPRELERIAAASDSPLPDDTEAVATGAEDAAETGPAEQVETGEAIDPEILRLVETRLAPILQRLAAVEVERAALMRTVNIAPMRAVAGLQVEIDALAERLAAVAAAQAEPSAAEATSSEPPRPTATGAA